LARIKSTLLGRSWKERAINLIYCQDLVKSPIMCVETFMMSIRNRWKNNSKNSSIWTNNLNNQKRVDKLKRLSCPERQGGNETKKVLMASS
jgi:hypothetical protein